MKSVLCNQGYIIVKNKFDSKIIDKIKKDLNVKPYVRGKRGMYAKKFQVYIETQTKLCIPKFYGLKELGKPDKVDIEDGKKIKVEFNNKFPLRDYQNDVIDHVLPLIKNQKGGTISLPPGRGKTVIANYLIHKLGEKTLVIVHKTFLMNQWKERIKQFLPNAKVGKIQGGTIDIEDKDIVIGMLQSISLKDDYPDNLFDSFGTLIIDESHHISSEKFSQLLQKVNTKYMIGLSGTPFRDDKLDKVINWHIGDIIYYEKPKVNQDVLVDMYKFDMDHPKFVTITNKYTQEVQVSSMISNIVKLSDRNKLISNIIKKCRENKSRKILVLSAMLDHLDYIQRRVEKMNIGTTSQYVGGMKQEDLTEAEGADIIFSTYSMSSEALDISTLNTVILATSRRKIEQSVGRILRKQKGAYLIQPLIIDIVDKLPVFTRQSYQRKTYYKKITNEKNINTYKCEGGKIIKEEKKSKTEIKNEDICIDSDSD